MTKLNNWAYAFVLNHEAAKVGVIYYAEKYFNRNGIVNPATAKAYTNEEIKAIKDNAKEGAKNYITNVCESAVVGMSVINSNKIYWYDEANSNVIIKSTLPLILDERTGNLANSDGIVVAKAM